jgi:hypothetical protein
MNRNLRELVQHLSERNPEPLPTVEEIQDAIMMQSTQDLHDANQSKHGHYDMGYLDRVVLLREIEVLRAKLAGALTSQREDGAPF